MSITTDHTHPIKIVTTCPKSGTYGCKHTCIFRQSDGSERSFIFSAADIHFMVKRRGIDAFVPVVAVNEYCVPIIVNSNSKDWMLKHFNTPPRDLYQSKEALQLDIAKYAPQLTRGKNP